MRNGRCDGNVPPPRKCACFTDDRERSPLEIQTLKNGIRPPPPFTARRTTSAKLHAERFHASRATCRGESLPARRIIPIPFSRQIEKQKNGSDVNSLFSHE